MHHIGIDIIEIPRIEGAIARWGDNFLGRVYTESELKSFQNKPSSLAARFAGKEAAIKALSPQVKGIGWKEVEILSEPDGRPAIRLLGKANEQAKDMGLYSLAISLSHCKEYAVALVTAETK
jgi:holo-[acyl-carrier protein] synthase